MRDHVPHVKSPRMKTSLLFSLCLFAIALLDIGCVLNVGPSSPRPNVLMHASDAPAGLVLAQGVQETYVIPRTGSINQINVSGWRTTLEAGFHNAFPTETAQNGRQLEILQAELGFSPRAVGPGGTAAISANVRFKARLLGPSHEELGIFVGTAQAREAITSVSGTTDNASKAVEAMYELIANEIANAAVVPEPKKVASSQHAAVKPARSQ